jgi:predicted nucleic acid-binding protein
VKLVVAEDHSSTLRRVCDDGELVASSLVLVEVPRALGRHRPSAGWRESWQDVLEQVRLLNMTRSLLAAAGEMEPAELRALDAIHLASAQRFGRTLTGLLTYDVRLFRAAKSAGVPSVAPGTSW